MMSEYLCRVRIDLTTAPKNNRNDIILDRFKHFDNGIIVLEEKHETVKIFPRETTKHFSEIVGKAKMCHSDFNTNLLQPVQKKAIFVFNEGKVSVLEENIFTNLEKSIEMEFNSCVELKYDAIQRSLQVVLHQLIIKKQRKKVSGVVLPRPLKSDSITQFPLESYFETIYMTDEDGNTDVRYSLQFCVENVIQPDGRRLSSLHLHSDSGDSGRSNVGQSISNSHQNSVGNSQSENSLQHSPQIDSGPSLLSVAVNVSSNGESDTENAQRPRHPGFAEYNSRKASFATWQQFQFFDTDVLARAGFYYIGEGTMVRCFFCSTELANLSPNDDPMLEHVRKSPSCRHLRSNLGSRRIADYQARICNGHRDSQQANGAAEDASRVTSRNAGSWSASDHIRSPKYQAYSIRLSSFACWPSDIRQRPEQVADAGFYYTGLQDVVRCFACDGGLKNFDPEDDPWIEHARWFPQCPFVKRVKGQEFIDLVRRMTEDSDEEEDAVVHSTFQPNNPMADAPSLRNELNPQLDQENAENVLETDAAKCALDAGYSRDIVARTINELHIKVKHVDEVYKYNKFKAREDTHESMPCVYKMYFVRTMQCVRHMVRECMDRQMPNHQERKFLVAESALLSLFNFCVKCGNEAQGHINHRMGTFINIIQKCDFCCNKRSWNSQPFVGSIPAGNLQLSAAILFAGAIPTQALRIFEFLKMAHTNIDTFFMHQRYYLQPAITHFWKQKQESYFEEVSCGGGSIAVAGDGRADSPGHSAKFEIYTTMDVNTGKVVRLEIVQSNEVKSSYHMELEGLKRTCDVFQENGIHIKSIITDRQTQVTKWVKENLSDCTHYYDIWHCAKGFKKKMNLLAKKKECKDLKFWTRSVTNHMYWVAASTPDGNKAVMLPKWHSIVNHIQNIHDGHGDLFPKCLHDDLDGCEMKKKKWLKPGKLDYTSKDIMELIQKKKDNGELAIEAHGDMNPSTTPWSSTQKNDSKQSLIEENERLRRSMLCVDCKVAKKDILLLPCTHLCLCSNCSDKTSICPLCYIKIREKIKTYVI